MPSHLIPSLATVIDTAIYPDHGHNILLYEKATSMYSPFWGLNGSHWGWKSNSQSLNVANLIGILVINLIPYHSHLLLLLIYVVLRALWKIDVHLISTLVNKSLYYYIIIIIINLPPVKAVKGLKNVTILSVE